MGFLSVSDLIQLGMLLITATDLVINIYKILHKK